MNKLINMATISNPQTKKIYQLIISDIDKNVEEGQKAHSTLTNTDIANALNMSAFTVRDKMLKLTKKGYFQRLNNFWDEENKFHPRIIYRGKIDG